MPFTNDYVPKNLQQNKTNNPYVSFIRNFWLWFGGVLKSNYIVAKATWCDVPAEPWVHPITLMLKTGWRDLGPLVEDRYDDKTP